MQNPTEPTQTIMDEQGQVKEKEKETTTTTTTTRNVVYGIFNIHKHSHHADTQQKQFFVHTPQNISSS